MKVFELKKWLECLDDDVNIIIDYTCSDDWYSYYGSDIVVTFDGKDIVLVVEN